ncbi:Rieske 2Fe-2S domain-containing protein [Thalassoroseus pseudoceratinae]|uniref:Rieske 2Fe-2S domain-containing protein n=1 Tax=Thalassoroseus pseudoceratinae TaxID=2713176 RepID=UPI00197E6E73|nr:Rieske 2Fe-2S domain-containing protein [Thalassoroseus pseudoceratinae]
MGKKKTTQEILAELRAKDSSGGSSSEEPAADQSKAETPTESASPAEAPPAKSADKPKSTKDIMAALRAEAAGGGKAKPAEKTGAKPKSTKDIMAALRAETAGDGKAKPAASEATKPAAKAKPKAAAPPAGERPSVQEMIKVAREGAPDKPAEEKPKTRVKPASRRAAKKSDDDATRRSFLFDVLLAPFVLAWVAFASAATAFGLGVARYMMPNVLVEPPSRFKVGSPTDFPANTVSTKFKAEFGIWVVNANVDGEQMVYALRSVCTHLGCTPSWLEGEQKFKCPCHGSGFYITGVNFEGPAPRPLERVGISLGADGLLEVDKSVTFQQEMGQWGDSASYVPMV